MSSYYSSSDSSSSSSDSSSDEAEKLKNLKIKTTEINILLLGETGVGKSTFINSMANYLSIKYFQDAEEKGLVKLIPTVYKIKDKNNKDHEIKIGPKKDENEHLKTGESATQKVKTYVFPVWKGNVKVRIIDTPGMGDTRGIEQDEKNCDYIINYIRKLGKIHAICFLCKPTNSRKTVYFDYCIYQMLSHLEKDAAKNICFLFTNTRGSNYGPGDTYTILETIIKNVEKNSGVKIPFNQKNIYCFDNEGFRLLGAMEKKVQFDDSTKEKYIKSWVFSAKQCWIFIRQLQLHIEPYVPSKLLEVNFARKTLFQFSKILVDIVQLKTDNQCVLDRMEDNRNIQMQSITQLKRQKSRVTDVIEKHMSQPLLVCRSVPNCAEVYKVRGTDKWHYKKVCHSCYELGNNLRMFETGSPEIVNCHVIDRSTRKCTQCGCDFLLHMHVDYITELDEVLMADDDVGHSIAMQESMLSDMKEIADDVLMQIGQYQNEYDLIRNSCMNMSRYLNKHAIIAFSDNYKEYIDYLINQKQYSTSTIKSTTDSLKKLKEFYIEAEQAFKASFESRLFKQEDLNFDMKHEQFKNLFELAQFGKKLSDIYSLQKISASMGCEVKEYVHDTYFVKVHDKKRTGNGNKGPKNRGDRTRNTTGPRNYPDRPDSRTSNASGHSGHHRKQGPQPRRPERPDSRSSNSYRHDGGNHQYPPQHRPDLGPGYHPPPGAGYQQYPQHYPDSARTPRGSYNVTVNLDDPHSSNYHPPPPPPNYPTYGQHPPPPIYGQAPPYYPPPAYGQPPPPSAGGYYNQYEQANYRDHSAPRNAQSGRGHFNKNNQGNRRDDRDRRDDDRRDNRDRRENRRRDGSKPREGKDKKRSKSAVRNETVDPTPSSSARNREKSRTRVFTTVVFTGHRRPSN